MDREELAALALKERRAGRDPGAILAAAVKGKGADALDTGDTGGSPKAAEIEKQLEMIAEDASIRFGIPLPEMRALMGKLEMRRMLMEPGYFFRPDHVRQWGDVIKRMLLESDWYDGTVKSAPY